MTTQVNPSDARIFDELQELVALEVKDILATAAQEGFSARDVVTALELALQAEIEALADDNAMVPDGTSD
jgi:hypothetical protein